MGHNSCQAVSVVTFDSGETLAQRFRSHMGHSSTLYGFAMRGMADDWEAGGPTLEVCRGWEDSPNGTMVQLRFLAGVFRLVLTGQALEQLPLVIVAWQRALAQGNRSLSVFRPGAGGGS